MFSLSRSLPVLLAMVLASGPALSATMTWDKVSGNTISFGKSLAGGGPSLLMLSTPAATQNQANPLQNIARLDYYNAINLSRCFLFVCRPAPKQKRKFSVFEGSTLISRGVVRVLPLNNPTRDRFRMKVKYLASGYSWNGRMKRNVCERCTNTLLLQRIVPPAPVPLPPAAVMMGSAIAGLVAMRRFRRRAGRDSACAT